MGCSRPCCLSLNTDPQTAIMIRQSLEHSSREHEAFALLTDSLEQAASAAKRFGELRGDRRWLQIHNKLMEMRQLVFDIEQASQAKDLPPLMRR